MTYKQSGPLNSLPFNMPISNLKKILIYTFCFFPAPVLAMPPSPQLSSTTVWIGISIALVFFMQAGFALLECGASRAKNAINVIMKNYTDVCFGSLFFWAFGYAIMFGDSLSGLIGSSNFLPDTLSNDETISLLFQLMFAATAATIVSGAVAERMRFISYLICSILVCALIYPVFGHWAWAEQGWLKQLGFIDFAGATVVHSIGGWCALAAVIVLGPRLGRFSRAGDAHYIPGHNLPMIALGGFILWLGWFGFNGGSTTDYSKLGKVLLNTHLGACAGALGALLFQAFSNRPILMTTTVNATIAGLVSVTAGAQSMSASMSIITGLISGIILILGSDMLVRYKIDDVVSAVAVHGFSGAWGTLAAGLFYEGDMFSSSRVSIQLIGVLSAFIWGFFSAYFLFKLVNFFLPLRASSLHEQRGLDFTEHNEEGYAEFNQSITHSGLSK